jgi:esterase/lipase superfamily enzyme
MTTSVSLALATLWSELEALYGPNRWTSKQFQLWRILRIESEVEAEKALREALQDDSVAAKRVDELLLAIKPDFKKKAAPDAVGGKKEPFIRLPLLYATDRNVNEKFQDEEEDLDTRYGPKRSPDQSLTLGVAEISIPERHKPGKLQVPKWWKLEFKADPAKHICLLKLDEQKSDDLFAAEASKLLEGAEKREILIFIHGFRSSFANAARRAAQVAADSEFPGAIALYSWPSEDSTARYTFDANNVEYTQPHFRRFVDLLQNRFPDARLHFMAHSMGSRLLRWTLEQRPANAPELGEAVFAAADVDRQSFQNSVANFAGKASRVTLYASQYDRALRASKTLNGYPRAGDPADGILVTEGLDTIDASSVTHHLFSLNHGYIGDSRDLVNDLYYLIAQGQPAGKRFGLEEVALGSNHYYKFK